ncbi:PadR family transcriptional regulator [Aureimonas glaciei]|uniref:PadR family transcriptional regulator n=1 Tax=Aureimonas glaciei TaxID=1776957 RepID=A0A916XZ01_9HYPH|nr:PadR family transcriptional regulator [Aureimonas glaciei]GGD20830.1 PadR family transcriptional regulator [Aureimonas glaciei]
MFGHQHYFRSPFGHGCRGERHAGPHGRGMGRDGGEAPRGFGREGRRQRVFDGGELKLVLLKLIEEQPRHGYDLIREIEALSGKVYAPSPGVVYPTLTLLGDMGLVEEQKSEGARKLLGITEEGRQHLAENREAVEVAMARLAALAQFSEKTDSAPIRRSMQNLKMALQQRLSAASADKDTAFDIAEMLDEVARKIERL